MVCFALYSPPPHMSHYRQFELVPIVLVLSEEAVKGSRHAAVETVRQTISPIDVRFLLLPSNHIDQTINKESRQYFFRWSLIKCAGDYNKAKIYGQLPCLHLTSADDEGWKEVPRTRFNSISDHSFSVWPLRCGVFRMAVNHAHAVRR